MGFAVELADAVVDQLKGWSWDDLDRAKTIERRWLPTYDLEELYETLLVNVVPRGATITSADDQSDYFDVPIEIGLLEKPKPETHSTREQLEAGADKHEALVTELLDYFRSADGRYVCGAGGPAIIRTAIPTLVLLEHLEELRQLTSVIRLTVRSRR